MLLTRAFKQQPVTGASQFQDDSAIADWAIGSVNIASQNKWIQGGNDGNFRPNAPITREELAAILQRIVVDSPVAASLQKQPSSVIQMGWQYNQSTKQFETSVLESGINTLAPRWYFLDKQGAVTDGTDTALISWAAEHKFPIWAMVGNRSDQALSSSVLSNPATRTTFAANLAALVKKYKLSGINLDFENMAGKDRASFSLFVADLAQRLHALNAKLSIDVSPDLGSDWTEVFDYQSLGASADYIILMGYDEHYSGSSTAGSVSSMPWVKSGLETLLSEMDPHKIILALPIYNRDWSLKADGSAQSSDDISLFDQLNLLKDYNMKPVWNPVLGQYVSSYVQSGITHSIWLDEERSLSLKALLALQEHNLAGLAYWSTGSATADIWTSIHNVIRYAGYTFS